MQQELEQL
jgi:hypothetical protein